MIGSDYPQHQRRSRVINIDHDIGAGSSDNLGSLATQQSTELRTMASAYPSALAQLDQTGGVDARWLIEPVGSRTMDYKRVHMESADLFDAQSPAEQLRRKYEPNELACFRDGYFLENTIETLEDDCPGLGESVQHLLGLPCMQLVQNGVVECPDTSVTKEVPRTRMKVGILLSGGPAPGGHNVICGAYKMLKEINKNCELIGFLGGIDGLFNEQIRVIDDHLADLYMNTGGFDMLWSGRGKFGGVDDFEKAATICKRNHLDGLIIVGGDGTNSNAAILANYFREKEYRTVVVGVPKTIDGDLKSAAVECSFGFDTCAKVYSELIGNLATDICSSQQVYHVVRVMGRSASHLVMECALQTRPNLVYIGEEIQEKNISLAEIIDEFVNVVVERKEQKREYGIVLLPEGLIEFIPEIKKLITELNHILSKGEFKRESLSAEALAVWEHLPEDIQDQLLADREATGYIQVAKIQTERFLIALVEEKLRLLGHEHLIFMPHYFGYEGRCAMPSNFDCNLCYSLGKTAVSLLAANMSGYMAVVRGLKGDHNTWQPWGVPFARLMEVQYDVDGNPRPGIKRQILTLDDPLMKLLNNVRRIWTMEDLYRCPGPIQFEGPVANVANFTVDVPIEKALLWGDDATRIGTPCQLTKRIGQLSPLQAQRLEYELTLPRCLDHDYVVMTPTQTYNPKDPYTHRQILLYYPHLAAVDHFRCLSLVPGVPNSQSRGKRVGLLFLSRQSPGVTNIILGMLERLQRSGGQLFGFRGMGGVLEGKCVELFASNLSLFKNQGGCEVLGRCTDHRLLYKDTQRRVMKACNEHLLDGLVIVGSNLAMTEAAMLAEFFLEYKCRTGVIGIPATGSNNLTHELLEINIGFDTSSKLYSNLIGNVLADAASMPKYWHFIRIMGRAPSYEVLECALQTHPNMVLISEEYGSAQKSLNDVVQDIADVVATRSSMGKNFGTLLIPDGLLIHLQGVKTFMFEIEEIKRTLSIEDRDELFWNMTNLEGKFFDRLSSISKHALSNLSRHIRKGMIRLYLYIYTAESELPQVETEYLLAYLVENELEARRRKGTYNGHFAVIKHFFGYQGRSAMPSNFDANLAYATAQLAVACIENNVTGHCCSMRGLCGKPAKWIATTIPFTAMFQNIPAQQEVHHELAKARKETKTEDIPIIPSSEVNVNSKSFRWMKTAQEQWMYQDRYCNPGPLQYTSTTATFTTRSLYEEQFEYYQMLKDVQEYAGILLNSCAFGVEEEFLRNAYVNLHNLLVFRYLKDDLKMVYPNLKNVLSSRQAKLEQKKQDEEEKERNQAILDSPHSRPTPTMPQRNI